MRISPLNDHLKLPPPKHMEGRSDGRRNGSGSFSAEPSGFGGGADVKGGPGAGDGGAQGTWRGRQADCPRARSRSQDGQALVEAGQLAAAASALSAQADRPIAFDNADWPTLIFRFGPPSWFSVSRFHQ